MEAGKIIPNNHFAFVQYLAEWISLNPLPNLKPRRLVMMGINQETEPVHSLKVFLEMLGAPKTDFEVEYALSVNNDKEYRPKINDVLIYNPYQNVLTYPPSLQPSYREIYRNHSVWTLPRWSGWRWLKNCITLRGTSLKNISANMRYVGYAAILLSRQPEFTTQELTETEISRE
jgi:hypothetical protein